ncbi:putative amidohydrolase YtcJ [Natronospira proteinivora]|uniref:Amidohydrolase YtcJ n=1 Tax=Natronospira proteinivora TaxID=1807133 RepID=A0ABT1GA32_9GAMM|nr:amidohydrolase [Natronospira proteinivora]MCP1728175.1 putative amidohydrolase YtcJ [Natronospira proteinivora]
MFSIITRRGLMAIALGAAMGLLGACETGPSQADKLLINGNVYTLWNEQPRAEAVAVRGNRILAVGSQDSLADHVGEDTEVIDLGGATVLPGLADSHVHLAGIGEREMGLDLAGIDSLEAFLEAVEAEVEQAEGGDWIVGRGWLETHWEPPVFPTREDLDAIAPDNPVWLTRADGHGSVANSKALEIAGIDGDTPSPDGGEILHDDDGEPEGMLLGRAQWLVGQHVPEPDAGLDERLVLGAQRSLEMGWTQVHIASGDYEEVETLRDLFANGEIRLRVHQALRGPSEDAERLVSEGGFSGLYEGRYTMRGLKLAADGALGSGGAALLEDYEDREGRGYLQFEREEVEHLLEQALRNGVQVWTHAIGDRGNRFALDLYEDAFEAVPAGERAMADPRWRIEHAQLLHPDDLPRFAELDVIPSMQPSHAIGDLHYAHRRVGKERLRTAYAWQSLIDTGVPIAGGSDAPVEMGDPRIEFYAAVTRSDLDGFQDEHWYPEEAVSREEALKMFTLWPAKAVFEEDVRGSIEPGKYADFSIFGKDLMQVEAQAILDAPVVMTMVGGEILFDARD